MNGSRFGVVPLSPKQLALAYALIAAIGLLIMAFTMPPFANADEENHVLRADMIAQGRLVGAPIIHPSISVAQQPFHRLNFHPERRVSRSDYRTLNWGTLAPGFFPNTVIYPPTFYLPAAVALRVAQWLELPVLRGVLAARIATGVATIAIATVAIGLAESAAPWLALILLLPMSLALTAAVSQDGPMLASTALAVALWGKVARGGGRRSFAYLCLLLAVVAMARPPYVAFVALILPLPLPWRLRWAGMAFVLLCTGLWDLSQAPRVTLTPLPGGTPDPHLQALLVLHHPWRFARAFAITLQRYHAGLLESFIGRPGYLDVALPPMFLKAASVVLLIAGLAMLGKPRASYIFAIGGAVGGAVLGIGLIQYLTWTAVGAEIINGLQGRYYLAPALTFGCLLRRRSGHIGVVAVAFGAVSIAALVHATIVRYYLV